MTDIKNVFFCQNETPLLTQQLQTTKNENEKQETKLENQNEIEDNNSQNGRWDKNEHLRFLSGCLQYGNNWKKVETCVKTRTSTQIRSHAQKYIKKLEKKYYPNSNTITTQNTNKSPNKDTPIEGTNNKSNNNNNSFAATENINHINNNNNINIIDKSNNKSARLFNLKNEECNKGDNKTKLSEEQIKRLIEELPKPDFNIEIVEKILLSIFRLNKKFEDFQKNDMNFKKLNTTTTGKNKNNKNIFLCQKLKREINYEEKIQELLNSNNQNDLNKLYKIFDEGKDTIWYDILMTHLKDN